MSKLNILYYESEVLIMKLYHGSNVTGITKFKFSGDEIGSAPLHDEGLYFYNNFEKAKWWAGRRKGTTTVYETELDDFDRFAIIKEWNVEGIKKYIEYRDNPDRFNGAIIPCECDSKFDDAFFDAIIEDIVHCGNKENIDEKINKLFEKCKDCDYNRSAREEKYEIIIRNREIVNRLKITEHIIEKGD